MKKSRPSTQAFFHGDNDTTTASATATATATPLSSSIVSLVLIGALRRNEVQPRASNRSRRGATHKA